MVGGGRTETRNSNVGNFIRGYYLSPEEEGLGRSTIEKRGNLQGEGRSPRNLEGRPAVQSESPYSCVTEKKKRIRQKFKPQSLDSGPNRSENSKKEKTPHGVLGRGGKKEGW